MKITIRKKKSSAPIITGINAEVLADDQALEGLTALRLELKPHQVAKVCLEFHLDELDIDEQLLLELQAHNGHIVELKSESE